jgi:tetratricopeptide (TPR) repeat protein
MAARRSEAAHRAAAMRERDAAVAAEQEASRQREAAVAAEQQAEANFRQARRAVDQYLATIRESPLLADAGTRPLREQLLESARAFYQAIVDKATGDREPSPDVAAAHLRRGQILDELGDRDSARAAYRAALQPVGTTGRGQPHRRAADVAWAETCLALGELERAIELTRAVLDDDPAHVRARRVLHRAHLAAARHQASVGEGGSALTHFHAAQAGAGALDLGRQPGGSGSGRAG